jgi:hypothetical protein
MVDYLQMHGFAVTRCKPWGSNPGGSIYELARCPFDPEHTDGSVAFTLVNGVPGFKCQHDGCRRKGIRDVFAQYPVDSKTTVSASAERRMANGPRAVGSLSSGPGLRETGSLQNPVASPVAQLNTAGGNWPKSLRKEAFHGLVGEFVRTVEPHTEADPAALLVQLLVGFGNIIGRHAHFVAEADRHYMNLFAVMVGQTSKGRKGRDPGKRCPRKPHE